VNDERPRRRVTHRTAAEELSERDPRLAGLVELVGPPRLGAPQGSHFSALVRAVVYQQLAGAAASAIHGRLVAALGGVVSPEAVLGTPVELLRGAGLSAAKATSVRDLAAKTFDGTVVLDPGRLRREPDEEIISRLSTVRGIGRWTAEMFLIFQLRRLDVWPTGDLGVRRGYGILWGVATPTPRELGPRGDPFRPYRSVAAWYCWRACEVLGAAGPSAMTS